MLLLGLCLQVVLEVEAGPAPVRFGVPLPERTLAAGLALRGDGVLQWRPLPLPARHGQRWVELAVVGASSRIVVERGAVPAVLADGPAFARPLAGATATAGTSWHWRDGTVDQRLRTVFEVPTVADGEHYLAGEARTDENPELATRCLPAARLPRRCWEAAGLLPPDQGLARALRPWLRQVAHALVELPGARGAGDFGRSGDVVTNLEYDTTWALLRLALALPDEDLLLRARRCARHTIDRDLDAATGLPFAHGKDHRGAPAEPGHVWLRGLLWTAAVVADDELLDGARQIAHALAAMPAGGEGRQERARDYGWPLQELEAYLELIDDPAIAAAADRLAISIAQHFDERARTFRFGEGEVGQGTYFERAWLTGGVVLPALAAHLRRRPETELRRRVELATRALLDQIGNGQPGLPTHWRWAAGSTFAEHRGEHDPKAFLLLDGLPAPEQRRLLRRPALWSGLQETPPLDDPDLATSFTMIARCTWVYR